MAFSTTAKVPLARILAPSAKAIARLASILKKGGVVGVPTETVYGLAANALDAEACAEIFRVKDRPATDPLIVHVLALADAEAVAVFNDDARLLARAFWPGPLTLVLPKRENIPAIVTSGLDSVAVRVPKHAVFRSLLKAAGVPLAAPSANPFGYISPTTAKHVQESLGTRIAYVLDGGPCRVGVESTIVDLRTPRTPRVLRPGMITAEAISVVLGRPLSASRPRAKRPAAVRGEASAGQVAPGLLERHYSPNTPLRLVKRIHDRDVVESEIGKRVAWLFFAKPKDIVSGRQKPHVYWLSQHASPAEAGRALFRKLRQLDVRGYDTIVAERAPDSPEARALNDRLRRAAATRPGLVV